MTLQLKELSKESVLRALEKAERYRFLNEPTEAESICLDVIRLDPNNQRALVTLLLSLTDQYRQGGTHDKRAEEILPKLESAYDRLYYAGVIAERKAKATLQKNLPGSQYVAFELFTEALRHFEEAEKIHPAGNDDAVLRWNTCARTIERRKLTAAPHDQTEQPLE